MDALTSLSIYSDDTAAMCFAVDLWIEAEIIGERSRVLNQAHGVLRQTNLHGNYLSAGPPVDSDFRRLLSPLMAISFAMLSPMKIAHLEELTMILWHGKESENCLLR